MKTFKTFVAIGLAIFVIATPAYAATFMVTSLADNGGQATLRSAINAANSDDDGDTILFAGGLLGTIVLRSGLPTITGGMSIQSPAPSAITIDGAGIYRPFSIDATGQNVAISDIAVQNGLSQPDTQDGGAILLTAGHLSLDNCTFSGNTASGTYTYAGGGGALFVGSGATASLTNCTLVANTAFLEFGGGDGSGFGQSGAIYNDRAGTITLTDCIVSNNHGDAIFSAGSANLIRCSVENNSSSTSTGVINNTGSMTILDCTITGSPSGGMINCGVTNSGSLALTNCTLTNNPFGDVVSFAGTVNLTNCTLADNKDSFGALVISAGNVALVNSIIYGDARPEISLGSTAYCSAQNCDIQTSDLDDGVTDMGGNIDQDPLFDPAGLADNGGPTQTIALERDSPCYSAGTTNGAPVTDQRGIVRPSSPSIGAFDSNAALPTAPTPTISPSGGAVPSGQGVAITDSLMSAEIFYTTDGTIPTGSSTPYNGPFTVADTEIVKAVAVAQNDRDSAVASELFTVSSTSGSLVVTTLSDSGAGSLRSALAVADAVPNSTITFAIGLSGTITLASALPKLTTGVTIEGPGASVIAVDGARSFRVLSIDTGTSSVAISGLTIQNGAVDGTNLGGAILQQSGNLSLDNCDVLNNSSVASGAGGVCVYGGNAVIANCTFSGNTTGGAVCILPGATASIERCTMTANSSTSVGSCIYTDGTTQVNDCTLSKNGDTGGNFEAGAVYIDGGTAAFTNCTITDNAGTAVYNSGGGVARSNEPPVTLINCTVADNTGPALDNGEAANVRSTVTNCIFYNNGGVGYLWQEIRVDIGTVSATNCDIYEPFVTDYGVTDLGGNINADPLLSPLASNGGPTQTMALNIGSPCLGAGVATGAPANDQRGDLRSSPPSMGAWDGLPVGIYTFAAGLALVSTPADYTGQSLSQVFGYSSPKIATWNADTTQYDVTPASDAATTIVGRGYWVRFPQVVTITNPGTMTADNRPFLIPLSKGWNMIGDPFPAEEPIDVATVQLPGGLPQTLGMSGVGGPIDQGWYEFANGAYLNTFSLTPYQGYWIHAAANCTLSIPPP